MDDRRPLSRLTPIRLALFLLAWQTGAAAETDAVAAADLNNQAIVEAKEGRFEKAVSLLRQALVLAPNDPLVQKNLSFILTDFARNLYREGKSDQASQLLKEALEHYPENGPALVRLGDWYYLEKNDFAQAVATWKRSYGLIPAAYWAGIAERITQAQRDQEVERHFSVEKVGHFQVRFSGDSFRAAAAKLGSRFEMEFQRLAGQIGVPPGPVTVILYSGKEFKQVNTRRDWAIGFYDGRIRIRVEDLGTQREPWVCAHELAHAFLHQIYGSRIPTWVHEGYAQSAEPSRPLSPREQELAEGVASRRLWVPLKWLDSHFEQPTGGEDVERAYAEAKAVVHFLISEYGIEHFKQFLEDLSSGKEVEEAFDRNFSPSQWSRVEHGISELGPVSP